jgi:hypothetical protein
MRDIESSSLAATIQAELVRRQTSGWSYVLEGDKSIRDDDCGTGNDLELNETFDWPENKKHLAEVGAELGKDQVQFKELNELHYSQQINSYQTWKTPKRRYSWAKR